MAESHAESESIRLAEAAADMGRAHQYHRPDPARPGLAACKGTTDPLDGHFCQFQGTPQEQYAHLIERTAAAIKEAHRG